MAQKVSVPLAFHFTAPSSPPSDCWHLRFSLRVDIVRLISSHIIIIIIIIIIRFMWSLSKKIITHTDQVGRRRYDVWLRLFVCLFVWSITRNI